MAFRYTDANFTEQVIGPNLGCQGPVIRAEVGDKVRVVYRNLCSFPNSLHTHGMRYHKLSEAAPYDDNTGPKQKLDDSVEPGDSYVYNFEIPEQSGPGPNDGSSVMWMYHSHTNEMSDTYAGLMGPMIVTGYGLANPDGSPKDVELEIFQLWSIMDESKSPYFEDNVATANDEVDVEELLEDEEFEESNLMHSVNGYVFGNGPVNTMCLGQRVRWYESAMGSEMDLHTPHWHGETLLVFGRRRDVVDLIPATMVIADMSPQNPGLWMQHCHVDDHLIAGMILTFQVTRMCQ